MADNYEGALLGILTAFQIIHSSCAFSLGSKYRQGFFGNRMYLVIYAAFFSILSAVVLADPNPVSCVFHINCGTRDALVGLRYNPWFKTPQTYFNSIGHNVVRLLDLTTVPSVL